MKMQVGEALQKWSATVGLSASAPGRNAEILLGFLFSALLVGLAFQKITTTLITLRALALAPTLSRRVSEWVKSLDYSEHEAWGADGAGEEWIQRRKDAIDHLAGFFRSHCAKSIAWGNDIRGSFSDLRFTDANRVPFPFMRMMREKFSSAQW
jgi:glutamate-1-semialdehyde 2,1-aminomutase